jgi:CheY-like chemotaxis protein
MLTVLCIDDDRQVLSVRKAVLGAAGFQVLSANEAREGIAVANQEEIDVVVLDYSMPGMNGEEVARILKQGHPNVPIILCSGEDEIPEAVFEVVDAFVTKGDAPEFLVQTIKSLKARKRPPGCEDRRLDRSA